MFKKALILLIACPIYTYGNGFVRDYTLKLADNPRYAATIYFDSNEAERTCNGKIFFDKYLNDKKATNRCPRFFVVTAPKRTTCSLYFIPKGKQKEYVILFDRVNNKYNVAEASNDMNIKATESLVDVTRPFVGDPSLYTDLNIAVNDVQSICTDDLVLFIRNKCTNLLGNP